MIQITETLRRGRWLDCLSLAGHSYFILPVTVAFYSCPIQWLYDVELDDAEIVGLRMREERDER